MSNEFLNQMMAAGEEYGAKPIGKVIAKMRISLGYSGYVKGHRMDDIFQPFEKPGDNKRIFTQMTARIKELGGSSDAVFGLLVDVPKENILSFESDWDKKSFIDRHSQEEDYLMITDAMNDLSVGPGEWFWCTYESPESPSAVAKGDEGKYEKKKDGVPTGEFVFPRIVLPVKKFANEEAARIAVGSNDQWSKTAMSNYPDINEINNLSSEILEWLDKAKEGVAYANSEENFPLPVPPMPPIPKNVEQHTENLKQYIATIYTIELGDIDQLIAQSNPI